MIGIGHGNRNASSKQYSRNPSEFSLRRPTKDSRVVLNEPVVCVQARVGRVEIDQVSCARSLRRLDEVASSKNGIAQRPTCCPNLAFVADQNVRVTAERDVELTLLIYAIEAIEARL